jgi:hypoxanthine phosphoribosyltransferase
MLPDGERWMPAANGATPHPDIGEVLLTAEQIRARVRELAARISQDHADRELHLVCVLRGAALFASDLIRELTIPASLDFIATRSYGEGYQSSGVVRIVKDLEDPLESRHVLLVEDIIDTGLTLNYLQRLLRERKVAGLDVCALLDKPSARRVECEARYVGFTIPDAFVVGYGLDYQGRYRGLPFVGTLKREVYGGG